MAGADTGKKFRRSTMFDRIKLGALLLIGFVLPIMGCGSAQVDTLEVTPTSVTMVPGDTIQLTATGVYSHGTGPSTTQNLTDQVTWSTASADVATVSNTGVVTSVGQGTISITASIQGYTGLLSATSLVTVTGTSTGPNSNDITSLKIIPVSQTVSSPGDTATYEAVGTTAAGASVNVNGTVVWSSSSTEIATVNASTGVVTAVGPGTATISAIYTNADSTVATGTASFTVTGVGATDNDITTITVIPGSQSVPSPGDTATYVAIGTTGSGTTVSMQGQVTWTSSTPQIATINPQTGVATAVGQGTASIVAQFINADKTTATGVATLTVTGSGTTNSDVTGLSIIPSAQTVAAPGDTVAYSAVGTTASGSTENLTGQVIWSSSATNIATVNATSGIATAVSQGTTTITAQYTNSDKTVATGTATMTVNTSGNTNSDVTSITIIPGSQSVAAPGDQASFIAVGTTASGATVSLQGLAQYSSSSASIATVTEFTGVATGVSAGTATITAQFTNPDMTVASGTASFTVVAGATEQYTAVTILPSSQSISSGGSSDFIALATSGTTGLIENVTTSPNLQWLSTIPAVATITSAGVTKGVSAGTTTITALLTTGTGTVVSATADLTVSSSTPPEPILSLNIIPTSITVNNFYLTGQFLAIATYSTAPYVADVTNSPNTTWISTEPELFPVDTNSGGTPGASAGLVTAYASGSAVIVAEVVNPTNAQGQTDGTIETAQATFACPQIVPGPGVTNPSCYPNEPPVPTLLATLTVYNEGLNTTDWLVTAPSATGTPDVIHCGPGWVPTAQQPGTGSVCTSTYPMDVTTSVGTPGLVIEAQGGAFGGWSYNCIPSDAKGNYLPGPTFWTAAGPNYCVVTFVGSYIDSNNNTVLVDGINQTVGAIFN